MAKKQRLTYRQESIKFGPLGAAASGDSGTGSGSGIGIWRALEGSTLFKIPEDFRRDCGSLGSSALVVDGEGDLGSEVESEDVQSEGESGHDGDNDDDDDELWLDPMVSVPLEKVHTPHALLRIIRVSEDGTEMLMYGGCNIA